MEELEYHPSWFKMKLERKQLLQELPDNIAKNVLLACFEFIETGAIPEMDFTSKIAFFGFFPDLEEAWRSYEKRVEAGNRGGRPPKNT